MKSQAALRGIVLISFVIAFAGLHWQEQGLHLPRDEDLTEALTPKDVSDSNMTSNHVLNSAMRGIICFRSD